MKKALAVSLVLSLGACGGDPPGPNDYFPLKEGAAWGYAIGIKSFGQGGYGGRAELRCKGRQGDAWVLEWTQVITYEDGDGAPITETFLVSTSPKSISVLQSPSHALWLLPADFEKKSRRFSIEMKNSDSFSVDTSVGAEEEISTKEGRFQAVKVTGTRTDSHGKGTYAIWFAKGTGPVRIEMELEVRAAGQNQRLINDALLERLVR